MSQGLCPSDGQNKALQPKIVSAVPSVGLWVGGYFSTRLAEQPFQSQCGSPGTVRGLKPSFCEWAPLDGASICL